MQYNKAVLLSQLISSLELAFKELEESYKKNDKGSFETNKKNILDFQAKINQTLN